MAVLFPSPPVSGIAMLVELQPPLGPLTDWIRAADQHASHHLPLLVRAQRILGGQEKAGDAERQELADRLERWRYQHLDSHRDSPSPLGQRLAEVLDLASNELCGRNRRAPRCPRAAVSDTYRQPQEVVRGLTCLDPQVSLETVEQRAAELTRMRFRVPSSPRSASADRASEERVVTRPDADRSIRIGGTSISARRMLLYAPLYLSSHCINYCVYCGFRYPNEIERRHLNFDQAMEQAGKLARHGFRHLLLVAGDFPSLTSVSYFAGIVGALSEEGFSVAVEVAPMTASGYAALAAAGAVGVTLYQETYNEILYALYHPHGTKTSYDWRLEGLERAAEAGIHRLGLGVLLGLADPREDFVSLLRHALYLRSRFPEHAIAFSLPRVQQTPPGFETPHPVSDEMLIRLYCGLRLAMPDAELTLSTREPPALRDRLVGSCITQLSAGSSTVPGGYENGDPSPRCAAQFPVADRRTPEEIAELLSAEGFDVRWQLGGTP